MDVHLLWKAESTWGAIPMRHILMGYVFNLATGTALLPCTLPEHVPFTFDRVIAKTQFVSNILVSQKVYV